MSLALPWSLLGVLFLVLLEIHLFDYFKMELLNRELCKALIRNIIVLIFY
jgi:hypothetical protein